MNKCKKLYNAENAKQAGAELGQAQISFKLDTH